MKNILIFGLVILLTGCTPLMTAINENYVPPYEKKYDSFLGETEQKIASDYTSLLSSNNDGIVISRVFYPDTEIMIEYKEYTDRSMTKQIGAQKKWSDFGVPTNESNFVDGKKAGVEKNYHHKTGKLLSTGTYKNGEKEGAWVSHKNGREEMTYKGGLKDGKYSIFDEDESIIAEGIYKQDSLLENKVYNDKSWGKRNSAPGKEGIMPLFGDGCPELESYDAKKKCAQEKMLLFIYSNLKYPAIARENNVEGTAIVQFIVDKEGRVTEIDVIKGICDQIRTEVTRVLVKMPRWVPGMQDGENAKVLYTLPVKFKLQ